jgi:hypothetical protein
VFVFPPRSSGENEMKGCLVGTLGALHMGSAVHFSSCWHWMNTELIWGKNHAHVPGFLTCVVFCSSVLESRTVDHRRLGAELAPVLPGF